MALGSAPPGRMRVWPAVVLPLGLTFLFGAAAGLFFSKVAADRESADARALRLEGYARLEAGELAGRAREAAQEFVDARLRGRAEQERNIRVELKGVMDAASRVLTAGLEKTRRAASSPRDGVGSFPAGFESLRLYLELAETGTEGDQAVEAMRACLPELSALMPSGCSLSVVENNVREILSVGGGAVPEIARTEGMSREIIWDGGDGGRRWTLHLRLGEADAYPLPGAEETALHVSERLADARLEEAAWAGWLVDDSGRAAASFPVRADGDDAAGAPPFLGTPGEWVEIDGRRLVWQERAGRLTGVELVPAVAVAIDRPAPAPEWGGELARDVRWSATLGILGVLSLAAWAWFVRTLLVSRRSARRRPSSGLDMPAGETRPARPEAHAAARAAAEAALAAARGGAGKTAAAAARPSPSPARAGSGARALAGGPGVIVADITDEGEVVVEAEVRTPVSRPRLVIPSGSLLRLQERHRGGRGRPGCRVLDQAESRLVRELAGRVRPAAGEAAGCEERRTVRSGRATERFVPAK